MNNPDTLFVVIDQGTGTYDLHVNSYDTNGVNNIPVRYYWQDPDVEPVFDSTITNTAVLQKTAIDTVPWAIGSSKMNQGFSLLIYARDDDGLVRGDEFTVFADSAPAPITATSDAVAEGRKFTWSGMDAIDGLATEYRILIKKGAEFEAGDTTQQYIAIDWTAGSDPEFAFDAGVFTWTYTPTDGSGWYYWKILSRDKQGTITDRNLNSGAFTY